MKNYAKIATLLGLSVATLSASGYRIPENSLNSTALSAAYVAGANDADASYFNPANMAWMEDGVWTETALTYIHLTSVKFTDSGSEPSNTGVGPSNADSLKENFYIPTFHYVSPKVKDWRFGLSTVAPAGLSKRWDDAFPKSSAGEFTLKVIEVNPSASYKVNDKFAIGFGARGLYSEGVIRASGKAVYQDMAADSIDFGYNLALSYKPTNNLTLSTTYRSKVDLTVEGKADIDIGAGITSTDASTEVPVPATLALAAAYSFENTTVEFVLDRTYWSSYKELDFDFTNPTIEGAIGDPKPKNWKDVNAYRIGVTHQYSDKLKLMGAYVYDESPVPDTTLGFELPDSDAQLFSAGFEYKLNDKMSMGLSYLYDLKEKRTVNQNSTGVTGDIKGAFTDASAHLVTASFKYRF